MPRDPGEAYAFPIDQQMAIANLDGADAERVALFVQDVPIRICDLYHHSINVRMIDAPQLWRGQFQRNHQLMSAWINQHRAGLGGGRLVIGPKRRRPRH